MVWNRSTYQQCSTNPQPHVRIPHQIGESRKHNIPLVLQIEDSQWDYMLGLYFLKYWLVCPVPFRWSRAITRWSLLPHGRHGSFRLEGIISRLMTKSPLRGNLHGGRSSKPSVWRHSLASHQLHQLLFPSRRQVMDLSLQSKNLLQRRGELLTPPIWIVPSMAKIGFKCVRRW